MRDPKKPINVKRVAQIAHLVEALQLARLKGNPRASEDYSREIGVTVDTVRGWMTALAKSGLVEIAGRRCDGPLKNVTYLWQYRNPHNSED